jgi:phosphoglycolate phosphatase-like HAD superfamily hydrolase
MAIRLVAFDLDGTLIRGRNSLAVIGAGLGHPEWEMDMEILHMRDETPGM